MAVVVGAVAGLNIVIGSLVAPFPVAAVVTIFALCVAAAVLVADPNRHLAPLILMLGMPLLGVGLSEPPATALSAGALLLLGSIYGWLVSLIWPDRPGIQRPAKAAVPRRVMLAYGIQIGIAGAAGAALGFALDVDHPGWACAAALLISRPDRALLDARSIGRILSVFLGATAACVVAAFHPSNAVFAAVVLVVIAGAAGTAGSRWYVLPFFTTLLVLSMLIGDETESATHWFLERVALTLAGAALAVLAAWVVPRVMAVPGSTAVGSQKSNSDQSSGT
ncbi:FUSC family protein [Microbacterium sp. 4R-513]|uniref:FUSC family protein n=1 Tax=Microbacterium sp. 4R-513 TaxID=2567934 RepID=UPI0013E174CE|nr:FUSC family protein [Microbacterium sp. 4R-513]QIG39468.1 FUSC family protein [Microbacterium sp. 4R-513]